MNFIALAADLRAAVAEYQAGPRVLVVEPHAGIRQALLRLLRTHGLTVAEAADASGALQAVRDWHPTVVVLEPRLANPDPDGRRLIRLLLAIDRRLKVVAYTGAEVDAAGLLRAGTFRVLRKGLGTAPDLLGEIDAAATAYWHLPAES